MGSTARRLMPLALAALLLTGCAQGPGHTRAAGTLGGAAAGAVVGAALSPCECSGGAGWGALIGMIAGTVAAEGIAQDQERYGWCGRCGKPLPPDFEASCCECCVKR